MCQETFLRAFRALPGFRGQAKFSSWLYRIALNLCRDWMRRERRTPVVQAPEDVDLMELAAAAEPSESIEDLVARKDLTRLVERAMARLPEEQRTAIVLEGISRADVSGNRRSGRLPVEHGQDAVVSGADGAAARAGQEPTQDEAMTDSCCCGYARQSRRNAGRVSVRRDRRGAERRAFEAHLADVRRVPRRARRACAACARSSSNGRRRSRSFAGVSRQSDSRRQSAVRSPAVRTGGADPGVGAGRGGAAVPRRRPPASPTSTCATTRTA